MLLYVGTRLSGHVRHNDCCYLRKENGECGIEGRSASLSSHISGGCCANFTAYKWGEANMVSNVEFSQIIYS